MTGYAAPIWVAKRQGWRLVISQEDVVRGHVLTGAQAQVMAARERCKPSIRAVFLGRETG